MNEETMHAMTRTLRERRERLFAEVAETEDDLRALAEDRESELEERAQEERLARLLSRLDDRGKVELEEIDEALRRISAGRYGVCEGCAARIPDARLAVLPATRVCVECARAEDEVSREYAASRAVPPVRRSAPVPPDLGELSDAELTTWLRELARADGRIDAAELRIVCRHGVVHLEGALPSATEHSILLGLIEDVAGLAEVDDRLEVREVVGQREEGGVVTGRAGAAPEPGGGTEDVVASIEEGVSYTPPSGPSPDEE